MNKSVLLAYYVIVLLLGISNTINSNDAEIHFNQLSLKHKDIQSYIYCTTQDSTGYMWFASKGVIQRYDGVRLNTYNLSDLLSNSNNLNIPELHVNGRYLWIGTHAGLYCFDTEKEHVVPITMKGVTIDMLVKEIFTDKQNRLWIGTNEDFYIGEFDEQNKQLKVYQANAYISSAVELPTKYGQIRNICSDNQSKVWVATYERLFQFSVDKKEIRLEKELTTEFKFKRKFKDLEYYNGKLYAIKGKFIEILEPPSSSNERMKTIHEIALVDIVLEHRSRELTQYNDMVIDEDGDIWMITNFGVLHIRLNNLSYQGSSLYKQPIFYNQKLLSFKLNHIYKDASNCIWISSNAGDVFFISLNNQRFFHHNIQNNEAYRNFLHKTRCFEVSENNTIWIGTHERGLFKYNMKDNSVQRFLYSKSDYKMFPGYIHALCYNNSNKVLAISSRRGLILHHTQTNENHFISQSESSGFDRRVNKMVTDQQGNFWGTTNKSLVTFGKNEKGKYVLLDTISQRLSFHLKSFDFNDIYYDSISNSVFVCTNKGIKLISISDSMIPDELISFDQFKEAPSFLKSNITTMCRVDRNRFFLMNSKKELAYWTTADNPENAKIKIIDKQKYKHFKLGNRLVLLNGYIYIIGEDLIRFHVDQNDFIRMPIPESYLLASQSNKLLVFNENLYFQYQNNIYTFNPKNLKKSNFSPYVVIPHIEINGEDIVSSDTVFKSKISGSQRTIKLKHNQNDIKFNFASLCYDNPEKINYKYRLVGYNTKWSYTTGNHPYVKYSNLKFGTYHFICFGTNQYGEWSEKSAKLTVVITPPWYLTKVSIFSYCIIIAFIIYCIYYYSNKWIHLKHELSFRERLHTAKIQFFTNISHELRTPLALIMMPLKELRKKEFSVYDKQLVELIYKNTTKISHIVDELLEFRKLEEHMNVLKLNRLHLNYAIKEIALEFTNLAQQKNIDFEINYSNEDIIAWLDTYKVERIVTNLLVNSIKYTKEGGKIELEILPDSKNFTFEKNKPIKTIVKTSPEIADDCFALVVKDTGKGIPTKLLLEIFNPFYQLPETDESRTHGNGIGLAIVKGYIKAHRGELIIASKPGVGTEIMIKLPKNDLVYTPEEKCQHQKQPEIKNTKALPNNSMVEIPKMAEGNTLPKILLVEDHEELRLYLKSRLLLYYDVIEANNGKEGLLLAKKYLPDIVISDWMMPGMSGIDMTKAIKQDVNTSHIPVIVLTAKTGMDYSILSTQYGSDYFITKPVDMDYLLSLLNTILENRNKVIKKYASNALFESNELVENEKDKSFINQLNTLIEKNISNHQFNEQALCEALGISRAQLYRKLKAISNQSPGEYLRYKRLNIGAKLLIYDNLNVTEVADRIGTTSATFIRLFKKQFNETPMEYIKKMKNRNTKDISVKMTSNVDN